MNSENFYDKKYFDYQKPMGVFGGWANMFKFEEFIKPSDDILDFGAGGGYLLNNINCKSKLAVEINTSCHKQLKEFGINYKETLSEVDDQSVSLIISNHALEHLKNPLKELILMKKKLNKNGKLVIVVPCEAFSQKYTDDDNNRHLFTWSPLNLGNLLVEAGFKIIEIKPIFHKWPPFYNFFLKLTGRTFLFHIICYIYGRIKKDLVQIRAVCEI